jgi:hypothetical protein
MVAPVSVVAPVEAAQAEACYRAALVVPAEVVVPVLVVTPAEAAQAGNCCRIVAELRRPEPCITEKKQLPVSVLYCVEA